MYVILVYITIKCKICHKNHVLDKKNTFKEIDNLPA